MGCGRDADYMGGVKIVARCTVGSGIVGTKVHRVVHMLSAYHDRTAAHGYRPQRVLRLARSCSGFRYRYRLISSMATF